MSYAQANYTAENRTVTPGQVRAVTVQSWKKAPAATVATGMAAPVAHDPRLVAQEARTASGAVDAGRSFDMVLAEERTVHSGGFAGALAMSHNAPQQAAAPSSSFSFDDVIDVINPLHHLPVIGMIYRELTGDKIGPVAQIVGGGIFGGPVGAISGTVNAVVQETTGKDIGGNVIALVSGDDGTFVPDAAPAAINRDNPEMALSMASSRYTGEDYLPPAVASSVNNADNAQARYAAAAYQRHAGNDGGGAVGANALPAIDVDYYQQALNANNTADNAVIAMPATPVFGGLY